MEDEDADEEEEGEENVHLHFLTVLFTSVIFNFFKISVYGYSRIPIDQMKIKRSTMSLVQLLHLHIVANFQNISFAFQKYYNLNNSMAVQSW